MRQVIKLMLRPVSALSLVVPMFGVLVWCVLLGSLASVAGAEGCPDQQARVETGSARLPDCRAYELVSPAEKNGNQAGATGRRVDYAIASPEGEGLLYETSGPFGITSTGVDQLALARRSPTGWASRDPLPRPENVDLLENRLEAYDPSADLSQLLFTAPGSFVPVNPSGLESQSVYIAHQDGSLSWIGEPSIPNPIPALGHVAQNGSWPAGGSPDLSTVYFTYYGTLVAEDASRAANVLAKGSPANSPWGFYEWREGVLKAAGELPPGSSNGPFDQYGAVPAAIGIEGGAVTPEEFDNEVSADGSRAFFVSPDPHYCGGGHCGADVPELYVRETAATGTHSTVLVSKTEQGQPALHGPLAVVTPHFSSKQPAYVYASPDGTRAFFESVDQLTRSAPNDGLPKAYEFNLDTGSVTYLPGAADPGTAPILASSRDGSRFIFAKRENERATELDLWVGGQVTKIAQLPEPAETEANHNVSCSSANHVCIDPARATADGSVFVFETDSPIQPPSGATFNNGGGFEQVYRYDVASEGSSLSCLSCPPAGVVPSGDASLSNDAIQPGPAEEAGNTHLVPNRDISADGGRVFFDTPEALVSQDVNGKRDVYEWENGSVYLISAGTGPGESFLLDSSSSGSDLFFATTDGLSPTDTDNGFDVYDARSPHILGESVGFPPVFSSIPCLSDCQSLPSIPPALGVPSGSAIFSGAGNLSGAVANPPMKVAHGKKAGSGKRNKRRNASVKRRARTSHRRGHRTGR